jgi:hypothetical protein
MTDTGTDIKTQTKDRDRDRDAERETKPESQREERAPHCFLFKARRPPWALTLTTPSSRNHLPQPVATIPPWGLGSRHLNFSRKGEKNKSL